MEYREVRGREDGMQKVHLPQIYGTISAFTMRTRSTCQRTAIHNLICSRSTELNSYLEQDKPLDITAGNMHQHMQHANLGSFSRSVVPVSHSSTPLLCPPAEDMRFVRLVLERDGFAFCALFICTRRTRRVCLEGFVT